MINIGFGNHVAMDRIVSVVNGDKPSAPITRAIQAAEDEGLLVDATMGRKKRSALFMDSGHVVLSAISTATVIERLQERDRQRAWFEKARAGRRTSHDRSA